MILNLHIIAIKNQLNKINQLKEILEKHIASFL